MDHLQKLMTFLVIIIYHILLHHTYLVTCDFNRYFQFTAQTKPLTKETIELKVDTYFNKTNDYFVYTLQDPLPIYQNLIEKIMIHKNGLVALDELSAKNLPNNYPQNTKLSKKRLRDYNGQYLSIYSSINKQGSIYIRELNKREFYKLSCKDQLQIDRLLDFIRLSHAEADDFKVKSLLLVSWKDVSTTGENIQLTIQNNLKTNSYGLIIVTNGIYSYAIIQYWKIQWNEEDDFVDAVLPPEAGIFMGPLGGYQLPRSGKSVEPDLWTIESNVALPGEWLVPLYNSDGNAENVLNNLTQIGSNFIKSLVNDCDQSGTLSTPSAMNDDFSFDNSTEEWKAFGKVYQLSSSSSSTEFDNLTQKNKPKTSWTMLQEDMGNDSSGVEPEPTLNTYEEYQNPSDKQIEDDDLVEDNDFDNPDVDSSTDSMIVTTPELINTQTYYPMGVYDGDETRHMTMEASIIPERFSPVENYSTEPYISRTDTVQPELVQSSQTEQVQKCDAVRDCNSHNAVCYFVDGKACCTCDVGFFGSGNSKCWSEANDHKFAFFGTLVVHLGPLGQSTSLPIYLDIQHGGFKRSSSGIRGGNSNDKAYQLLRFTTPIFHVLNALISSNCNQTQQSERIYSLFTLGGGLRNPFRLHFYFDVESVGRFTAQLTFQIHDTTSGSYTSGSLDMEISSSETLTIFNHAYREAYGVSETPGKTYYTSYHIDRSGRVVFPQQTVKFVMEQRDSRTTAPEEINVHWSAIADSDNCLLKSGELIPTERPFYIRLEDRGYCSEDCSQENSTCNFFCVDEPILLAHKPDPCDCVICDRSDEICRPHGSTYQCTCADGMTRMPDGSCQIGSATSVSSANGPQCGSIHCHADARCVNAEQAFCQCLPGYRGDGISFCEIDPCAKCRRSEVCENGVCVPSGVDLCEGVQCGEKAYCQDGACICQSGYTGDPTIKCYEERELCAGVQCHRFGQCYENRCYCIHGYVGDGVNFCDARTIDPCDGISCAPNARCLDGKCTCNPGYEGDGQTKCRLAEDICTDTQCHENAQCVDNRCECKPGYKGDGYTNCTAETTGPIAGCGNCRGIPFKELAQCVADRCVCAPGFVEAQPGLCMECIQENCYRNAICRPNDRFNGAYSCQCKPGFTGDGITSCVPDKKVPEPESPDFPCGGACRARNSECDHATGKCKCRMNYEGDPERECYWNCRLCLPTAICDKDNERCTCPHGYHGDGQTYCERIPIQPDPVKVSIEGEGQVHHVTDLSQMLELRCYVLTQDRSLIGKWIQPTSSQASDITVSRRPDGIEVVLRIKEPVKSDSGRYICRAGNAESFIDVNVEETAVPFTIFLTSDDGILSTSTSDTNVTKATLWNIAENNKYGRVAMVTDCNNERVIYTCDYGHGIRWGDANSEQKKLSTKEIYNSQLSRFSNMAVDPFSGNLFVWDESYGKITIFNPGKPNIRYTLKSVKSLSSTVPQHLAGLVVHPKNGLIYWALFTDGWRPNGTIQVSSMLGENEEQLIQLTGEPLSLSLSPSMNNRGTSAGQLCWMQRSTKGIYGLITELHCARLSVNGRRIITNEKVKEFGPNEEPSYGLVQHKGTLLWTDATKTVYYSLNPERRVRVRHVCCSNRFQAVAVMSKCHQAMSNPCSYSNGQCRYLCIPNEDQRTRTCVCPDDEPGCHREV